MSPQDIFEEISSLLKKKEDNSTILKDEKSNGKKWNYSICATPISLNRPLIIGINWGGGGRKDKFNYSVQDHMPTRKEFLCELKNRDYKFLLNSQNYILRYLKLDIYNGDFNYSNVCFFRTPNIQYLKGEDFEISVPIFKKMVNYLQPSWILSLGNTNITYLEKFFNIPDEISLREILLNEKRIGKFEVIGYTGTLLSRPFYCLPHPGAHIFKTDRDEIWKSVFSCELEK